MGIKASVFIATSLDGFNRAAGRFAGLPALIAIAALLWVPSANSQSAPSQPPRRVLELQQSFALEAQLFRGRTSVAEGATAANARVVRPTQDTIMFAEP